MHLLYNFTCFDEIFPVVLLYNNYKMERLTIDILIALIAILATDMEMLRHQRVSCYRNPLGVMQQYPD